MKIKLNNIDEHSYSSFMEVKRRRENSDGMVLRKMLELSAAFSLSHSHGFPFPYSFIQVIFVQI